MSSPNLPPSSSASKLNELQATLLVLKNEARILSNALRDIELTLQSGPLEIPASEYREIAQALTTNLSETTKRIKELEEERNHLGH